MNAVRIDRPTLRSAFGGDYAALWAVVAAGDGVRNEQGAAAKDPDLRELGIDRKVARMTDKQARLLMAAAIECIAEVDESARAQCGLYIGVPTVDEPMPQLAAVADWHEERGRTPLAEHFKRHSAPLGWLAMLNSSAAAHVSTRLRITGSNGVYSPFADAGLNALIDAAAAIVDGDCVQALVGAVAPKLDPMLTVQYAHWCAPGQRLPPSEASACVLLSRSEAGDGVCLRGYARGFAPMPWDETVVSEVVAQALAMAGLASTQIGWALSAGGWNAAQDAALRAALAGFALTGAALPVESALGRLGPAAPLLALGLGLHGLQRSEALHAADSGEIDSRAMTQRNVLIVAVSPQGQCVAVVIGDDA